MHNRQWALSWLRGMAKAIQRGSFRASELDGFIAAAKRHGLSDEEIAIALGRDDVKSEPRTQE